MIRLQRLNPNERLVIESPVNRYKLAGPGRVLITPRQRILTRLYVGPSGQSFQYKAVRTLEEVSLDMTVQILYRLDPDLFTDDLLSRVANLNNGMWHKILHWQTEYVLRMLIAQYPWRDLNRADVQKRLERQLTQTLADRLKMVGMAVLSICLVKTELPVGLQKTLIQTEKDTIEATGRAKVLESYFDIFGANLSKVMPYIIQWEVVNAIHRNGDAKALLTSDGVTPKPVLLLNEAIPNTTYLQKQLPLQ
jgi:hypothetical protein